MAKFLTLRNNFARAIPFALRRQIPEFIYRHLYTFGSFETRIFKNEGLLLHSCGNQIENDIFWRGFTDSRERLSIKFWIKLCKLLQPKVIWDVGANTGTYGLLAKHYSRGSSVMLFDPLILPLRIAQMNFQLNEYKAVFLNYALGDYNGVGKVYIDNAVDFVYSVTINANMLANSDARQLQVNVKKASTFIAERRDVPSLMKIDVETFEPEVLSGFESWSLENTCVLIEVLDDEIGKKIEKYFPSESFLFLNLDDTNNSFRFQNAITKSDDLNYLLIPKALNKNVLDDFLSYAIQFQ